MAKRNGATTPAAPAAPAAGLAASLAARSTKAPDLQGKDPSVIEWDAGNGVSAFQAGQLPPEQEGGEVATGDEGADAAADDAVAPAGSADDAAAPGRDSSGRFTASTEGNQGDGGTKPGTVSPPAAAAKPKGSEARSRTFAALDAEQKRVALERQARQDADRAQAAEAELQRIKKLPLKEQLKWLNADKASLEEALLVGGDDVAELPEKKPPGPDPEKEELKQRLAALEARDGAREAQTQQQQLAGAHQVVVEALKDVATVPLVKTVRDIVIDGQPIHSGIDLTLKVAHQSWLEGGKSGHPRDYVAGAADVVEAYLRGKRPDLAELVDARQPGAGGGQQPQGGAPAARKPAAPAMGKRQGARPDAQPTELPTDKYARDQQIKREMGWI